MAKLKEDFYLRNDVTGVARDLLGKLLITRIDGHYTAGTIVETEAYSWRERGCHAYAGRRTARNEAMFGAGGQAYVYLCYGIHHLFNVVTNREGVAEAVLIRALQPEQGQKTMLERSGKTNLRRITAGPGRLTRALGITTALNGALLGGRTVWLEEGPPVPPRLRLASQRIGIAYAGADAGLPWRFALAGNPWVSKK
jgi:DNA-3-methyladenine glycosylase